MHVGEIAAGLAGALDYAAQAYLDEETCEKTFRKRYARVATRSVRLCSVRLCFEHGMLGSTLVHIYICIYIYIAGLCLWLCKFDYVGSKWPGGACVQRPLRLLIVTLPPMQDTTQN